MSAGVFFSDSEKGRAMKTLTFVYVFGTVASIAAVLWSWYQVAEWLHYLRKGE